jgi:hypothetical protein
MSQAGANSSSGGGGGGGITTINGDTGSITGSTVTIYANNAANNSGSSVSFVNSGTISTLNVTDSNNNTIIGNDSGNSFVSGPFSASSFVTALGYGILKSLGGPGSLDECVFIGSDIASSLSNGNMVGCIGIGQAVFSAAVGAVIGDAIGIGNGTFGGITGNCSSSIAIGGNSLNTATTTTNTVSIGHTAMQAQTTGDHNTAIGSRALSANAISGSYNVALGFNVGSNYAGAESSNILISNAGVASENNTIHIGTQGTGNNEQSSCYIAGIEGSAVSGSTVIVNPSTGQLGVNGIANNTGQPAFSVYLSTNQGNVTGNNTQYQVPFDTVTFDQTSGYSTGTHLYTYPATGIYQHSVKLFLYGGSVASTQFFAWASYNGAAYPGDRIADLNPSSLGLAVNGEFLMTFSWLHKATAGDTVGIFIDVIGGASADVGAGGGTSGGCTFSGSMVC